MADVWISRKRWTCKYCDVTINDDLPSRRHHESGGRHKQNVRQALESLYRKGEQDRRDAEDTKKEMARIEALAAESYAKDLAGANATSSLPAPSSVSSSTQAANSVRTETPTSRAKPLRTGKSGPAEQSQRASQSAAQPGEWEQVVQPTPSASTSYAVETSDRDKAKSFRTREKVALLDDSDEDPETNTIKIKKRRRHASAAEEESPAIRTEAKKEEPADSTDVASAEADPHSSLQPNAATVALSVSGVKKEVTDELPASTEEDGVGGGSGGLFKKRRAGAGAGAKRVRAVI